MAEGQCPKTDRITPLDSLKIEQACVDVDVKWNLNQMCTCDKLNKIKQLFIQELINSHKNIHIYSVQPREQM